MSLAAAAIYMSSQVSKHKKTQEILLNVTGVLEEMIKQVYKLMYTKAFDLFPAGFSIFHPAADSVRFNFFKIYTNLLLIATIELKCFDKP